MNPHSICTRQQPSFRKRNRPGAYIPAVAGPSICSAVALMAVSAT